LTRIPVCSAVFDGNEASYLKECIDTGWVSSSGPFVSRFESAFAAHVGTTHAVTASSGTAALHLALLSLGISPGDEVIVPSLTMIASGNAILYTGATPVIVDVEPETGNIDPSRLEESITPRTRAVVLVHLYGLPCSMGRVLEICAENGLPVVEDAAEAIGTTYGERRAGRGGGIGCFSFFANKVVTTGEGGMLTTDDSETADRIRRFKDQWFVADRRFYHPHVGFNYRMSNLQAAVGLAQLERVEELCGARVQVARTYSRLLADVPQVELPLDSWEGGTNSHWMYAVKLAGTGESGRDELAAFLRSRGIDTRTFFIPLHKQPAFAGFAASCPVSEDLSQRGLLLPTGPTLTEAMQERIAFEIGNFFS